MKFSLLIPSLGVLLSTAAMAQNPVAPYGGPKSPLSLNGSNGSGRATSGCGVIDDFQTYVVAAGGAENILSLTLDDLTVTGTGQGPGLVVDGVTYSCTSNSLQWNGAGYFGQPSNNFLANGNDGTLTISYDVPATDVCMTLHAFDGFGDTATLNVLDSNGVTLNTTTLSLPGAIAVPYSYSGADIASVVISGTYSWSPIIDDHEFCSGPGVFTLRVGNLIAGTTATITTINGTANGNVGVAYSLTGGGPTTVTAGACGAVTALLSSPVTVLGIFPSSGTTMSTSANIPPGTTGVNVWLQALDIATCTLSNGVAEVIG